MINHIPDKLFKKYCDLVYQEAGIYLTQEKRGLLNARIGKRLRARRIDAADYFTMIQANPVELRAFIDTISTNHTFFFRESKSFKWLEKHHSSVWCAASSSGEEPYSIAIYCMDRGFVPSIMATDISETCLDKGIKGIYSFQSVSNLPGQTLKHYFQKGKNNWEGHVKVKKKIRDVITFKRFNLIKDPLPAESYDIIFLRNVMIYFDAKTKEHVVARLSSVLKKGGYFIIGGAESLSGLKNPFTYIEPSIYIKK